MSVVGQGADALRFLTPPVEQVSEPLMFSSGTLPGIAVNYACDRNGDGIGHLRIRGGALLSWRAPGSIDFGPEVDVSAGGQYQIIGEDFNNYLIVTSYAAYLPVGERSTTVRLRHRQGRVKRSEATTPSPYSEVWQNYFKNISTQALIRVRAWVDPAVQYISIGDNVAGPFTTPITEETAITLSATLAVNAIDSIFTKIVVSAAPTPPPTPDVPIVIHFSWDGG
jgi:hypothetical protein